MLRRQLTLQTERRDIWCGCDTLWGGFPPDPNIQLLLDHLQWYFSPHMCIFTVFVSIPDPMPGNGAMTVWQIRPQWMCTMACTLFRHPCNFCFAYILCEHLVWCGKTGQPNTLMSLKALVDSSQSHLSSQRCAETTDWCVWFKKRAWCVELASIATSKTSRIYRRVCYCLLCRCAPSHRLWRS